MGSFDRMCQFGVKFPPWFAMQLDKLGLSDSHKLRKTILRLCVPAMHAKTHGARCQWLNGQFAVVGTGLFQGEVPEVFNKTVRLHQLILREQKLMAHRTYVNALIHEMNMERQMELCEVLDLKQANTWLTLARTTTQLQELRATWPDANEQDWSVQLREAALAAGQDEVDGRAGA